MSTIESVWTWRCHPGDGIRIGSLAFRNNSLIYNLGFIDPDQKYLAVYLNNHCVYGPIKAITYARLAISMPGKSIEGYLVNLTERERDLIRIMDAMEDN